MQKILYVPAINADVIIARRKGTRNIRISVKSDGKIRLSIPWGASERQATQFLISKADWIEKNRKTVHVLKPGQHIGKSHRMNFVITENSKISTSVRNNLITIKLPAEFPLEHQDSQKAAHKAAERALSKEAGVLLPQRLDNLAVKHSISFNNLKVKKLKSRWGSCDNYKNITLNIYLMQLDWVLIDYVILHELSHTYYQHHQSDFWNYLESICPDYKEKRKSLKQKPTSIFSTDY